MRKLRDYLRYCKNAVADGKFLPHVNPDWGIEVHPGQTVIKYWGNGSIIAVPYNCDSESLHYYVARQLFPGGDRYTAESRLQQSLGTQNFSNMRQAIYNQRGGAVPIRSRWFRRLVCTALGLPPWQGRPATPEYVK